jgi:hypothetical protein
VKKPYIVAITLIIAGFFWTGGALLGRLGAMGAGLFDSGIKLSGVATIGPQGG